jgi:Ca-activated chloride channel family protein
VVFAMQRPMAEAMGWPEQPLGWSDLLGAFGRGETWEQFGYPEWGPLQLGMPDPTLTTAGLGGVMTLLDLDNDSAMSDQEMLGGIAFSQLVTAPAEDTEALLDSYAGADGEAQQHPAGFPVLERDLAAHLADASGLPLVPVYMKEGLVFADYPYAVLRAPWVDEGRQELAGQFLEFVQGEAGRQAYAEEGFRDPAHAAAGSALLAPDRGFLTEVPVPSREPSAEGLDELLGFWPLLARPTNILIVVDTSGSMNDAVPETDLSRLQLLKAAAIEGLGLLNNQTTMGLWEFSSGLTPTTPYQELIPLGPADEDVGEAPRRQAMTAAIQQLDADGGTGLYDTIHDAYQVMREAYQPGAQNMLVVITDGRDEFHDGRSLPELLAAVEEAVLPDQPLPVIALAVGPEADAESLEQVIELTGGRTIIARDREETIQQVVLAFAGRIS